MAHPHTLKANDSVLSPQPVTDHEVDWAAKRQNLTNDPKAGQVAGNAKAVLAIEDQSEMSAVAALDNVAGISFGLSLSPLVGVKCQAEADLLAGEKPSG